MTPQEHGETPRGLDTVELVEVLVSESEYRVYDALARLQGGAEYWCGSQDDLSAAADYDKRTVRTACRRLEGRGLIRIWAEPGRPLNYVLTAAPDGSPFAVRRRDARRGRDVVRDARPAGLAQQQIDALLASLEASPGGGSEGRITGADQGADHLPIRGGSPASDSPALTMSSSSSIRPLPPIRPPHPPPSSPVGSGDGDEPLPDGWEPVVRALAEIGVDPEPWIVRELAAAPDPSVWESAVRTAGEYGAETPLYVSRCYATALRRWEREQATRGSASDDASGEGAPADATAIPESADGRPTASTAGIATPSPAPAARPAVTVRPMPHPRPLTLAETAGVVAEQVAGALWRRVRRGGAR